jgi:dTDP-4-amino-4,6-dideoxygalactose transaminase
MLELRKKHASAVHSPIDFVSLKAQQACLRPQIDRAIQRVLDHGQYIMGPEVFALEEALANFCGVKHAVTCSSGTDALLMGLMAQGVGQGDAVLLPSFTFPATPEVIALLGATPVFIDVDEKTYNMDPCSLEEGIVSAKAKKLHPVGIIAVDLFGQPADYENIEVIARKQGLWLLCDAAQSFGALLNDRRVGQCGMATALSFFPAKPLGCYGDGGCILTDDDEKASLFRSIRTHGQGLHKYDNIRVGLNARLDTIQAAILIEKLKVFPTEWAARQKIACFYTKALKDYVHVPQLIDGAISSWAQYTVRLAEDMDRSECIAYLKGEGIPAMVYYAKPLHQQGAYQHYPTATGGALPVSERIANQVVSLPMSGYLEEQQQTYILKKCLEYFGGRI